MDKYIAFLIGLIAAVLTSTSYAAYYSGGYGYSRPQVKWVCNPYNNNCRKVYYPQGRYTEYERNRWPKNFRKKKVAKNTEPKHVFVAPPEKIEKTNIINVNLAHGTWGAYDSEGNLVNSGHVSGGKSFCPDINKKCKTVTGTFKVYEKRGSNCKSKIFPVGKGGAPMPYCMFFHEGYAMHGSNAVPNYNASHGCVRMSSADAQWLNQNFVNVGTTRVNITYDKLEPKEDKSEPQEKKESSENKT